MRGGSRISVISVWRSAVSSADALILRHCCNSPAVALSRSASCRNRSAWHETEYFQVIVVERFLKPDRINLQQKDDHPIHQYSLETPQISNRTAWLNDLSG